MSSPRSSSPAGVVQTAHGAWIALVVTGLVIGAAFIAVYVGLQRDPVPLHLPIAVAGSQLAAAADRGLGDAVDVTEVSTLEEGATLVRDGNAVAAFGAVSQTSLQLDYAGARGLSESGAARSIVGGLAAKADFTVSEKDVVPLVRYDSRGLVGFYVVFGVTLSSFVLAQGLTGAVARIRLRHRLYAIGGFAVLIGLVAAVIAGPVYGALNAPFPILSLTLILLSAASALATKALGAWLGAAGIGLAVLILTTVGNAVSGATIGVDLLPWWAQTLSPILPPGAAFRAVNEFGYFNGANAWSSLVVLAAWALVGLVLVVARQSLTLRKASTTPISEPAPALVDA